MGIVRTLMVLWANVDARIQRKPPVEPVEPVEPETRRLERRPRVPDGIPTPEARAKGWPTDAELRMPLSERFPIRGTETITTVRLNFGKRAVPPPAHVTACPCQRCRNDRAREVARRQGAARAAGRWPM